MPDQRDSIPYLRGQLEEVRRTLVCTQREAREALRLSALVSAVFPQISDACTQLMALDADVTQRITCVDQALVDVENLPDEDDVKDLSQLLRPAAKAGLAAMHCAPAGTLLN